MGLTQNEFKQPQSVFAPWNFTQGLAMPSFTYAKLPPAEQRARHIVWVEDEGLWRFSDGFEWRVLTAVETPNITESSVVTVTPGAASYGSWTTLFAATSRRAFQVSFFIQGGTYSVVSREIFEFGIGPAGAEMAMIAPIGFVTVGFDHVVFPFEVPAGSRLACRALYITSGVKSVDPSITSVLGGRDGG